MVDKDTIDTEYEKVQKNIEKIIAEMEDLTKQQVDQVNEKESIGKIIFRKDSYKIEKVVRLFRSGIITQEEARGALDLPDINLSEMKMDLPKFRKVKNARNRYDYLCRKLNENKHLSERDEEDYSTLYELFEGGVSENDKIQTNSDKIQTHEPA
jgi:hypothetical protein